MVPLWSGGLTKINIDDIEKIQKICFKIILSQNYICYSKALETLKEITLEQRRKNLCKKFAKKSVENPKINFLFKKAKNLKTRSGKKYVEPFTKTNRAYTGCVPYLTRLLNE